MSSETKYGATPVRTNKWGSFDFRVFHHEDYHDNGCP